MDTAVGGNAFPMSIYRSEIQSLLGSAEQGRIRIGDFVSSFPRLAESLKRDASSNALELWGWSSNVDEFEQATIVDRKLLSVIGRIARIDIRSDDRYHAGLMHTYGYLLSLLETRFGYKHERWTGGRIEMGLGIGEPIFQPTVGSGTLLQNATFLLASLLARFHPMEFSELAETCPDVSPALLSYRFEPLAITSIVEQFSIESLGRFSLITLLVSLPNPTESHDALVVYALREPTLSRPRLVTCFPISRVARKAIHQEQSEADEVEIRLRYNARSELLDSHSQSPTPLIGSRRWGVLGD